MGKPRRSSGRAEFKRGTWFAVVRLEHVRHGKRKWIEIPLEPGETLTQEQANAIAAAYQARHDSGEDLSAPAPAGGDVLVPAYCIAWASKQTYDSAPKDEGAFKRYLPRSPLATIRVPMLRPRHALAFVQWLQKQPSAKGGTLAPRTVRNTVDAVRRALDAAVFDELLPVNPFDKLPSGTLPRIADKIPGARRGWKFDPHEIVQLVSDPIVPADERMETALKFGMGARPSEVHVVRVRDWDRNVKPLSRITISIARKSTSRTLGHTKTYAVKEVPVAPWLHEMLVDWIDRGFESHFGRKPRPDDYIVPSGAFTPRDENHTNEKFKAGCVALGLTPRHQYTLRHTLIRLMRDARADRSVVRWVTHAPPKSTYDGYSDAPPWDILCAEWSKLRLPFPPGADTGADVPASNAANAERDERKHRGIEGHSDVASGAEPRDSEGGPSRVDRFSRRVAPMAQTSAAPVTRESAFAFVRGWTAGEVLN